MLLQSSWLLLPVLARVGVTAESQMGGASNVELYRVARQYATQPKELLAVL